MSSLNKIHVNSATGLSLNDRFTAMAERRVRTRSQNRNNSQGEQSVNPHVAAANRRLLLQLERRHKMLAAMKLKRRSLRAPIGTMLKRGSIKALRVAPNGKPIKANTLTKVATMNADLVSNTRRRSRSLRRTGSVPPIVNRLGVRGIGGAAERIAKRRIARLRSQLKQFGNSYSAPNSRQSRSRSRAPTTNRPNTAGPPGRTQSRGRSRSRGRSQSRGRRPASLNVRRGRSISKNRAQIRNHPDTLPVQSRLGVRRNRSANIARGGIQKRSAVARNGQNRNVTGGRLAQTRGRSRSRSGARKGHLQQLQLNTGARNAGMGQRGRSRQRGFGKNNTNGMKKGQQRQQQQKQQQQQRRGRSRSRRRDGRNLGPGPGKNVQQVPNKDDLDKELDQYMATSKTENDMGYLLRN